MTRLRDSQKSKLYRAERMLPEFRMKDLGARPSPEEMQVFVDKVQGSAWYKRQKFATRFRITAHPSRGKGGAYAMGYSIYVSTYYRNRLIILHEMAHCLNSGEGNDHHGRRYAAIYLKLVQHVMGREVAARLKAAFKHHRVKFRPKRKLSPETLANLRERGRLLAAARKVQP